jgi:hypothetical protein
MDGVLVVETVPARRAVEVPQVIEDEVSVGGKAAEGGLELFPGLSVGQGLAEEVPEAPIPDPSHRGRHSVLLLSADFRRIWRVEGRGTVSGIRWYKDG